MIRKLFEEIFKPQLTKEIRGIAIGVPVDDVIAVEGTDYYEETEITPHLQYYFTISSFPKTEYKLVYYYNKNRLVFSIYLFLAYNPRRSDMDRPTFEELAKETLNYFDQKYGSHQLIKEKIEAGILLEYSWKQEAPEPGIEVFLMVYDEYLNGNERVLKVVIRAGN